MLFCKALIVPGLVQATKRSGHGLQASATPTFTPQKRNKINSCNQQKDAGTWVANHRQLLLWQKTPIQLVQPTKRQEHELQPIATHTMIAKELSTRRSLMQAEVDS